MIGPIGAVIVLTDRTMAGHDIVEVVSKAAAGGAGAVIFREKDLPVDERLALGRQVAEALQGTGTDLIVASDPVLADRLDACGVHLARTDLLCDRPPSIIGRSCHDGAELAAAAGEGADYATLSPVFATPSKPGYGPPLGPEAALAMMPPDAPSIALYALGGVTPANAPACAAAGFAGVAVMGSVMVADDPGQVVTDLVHALSTDAALHADAPVDR